MTDSGRYPDLPRRPFLSGPGAGIPRQAYAGGSDLIREPFTTAGTAAVVAVIDDRQRRKLATGTVLIDSLGGAIDDVRPDATAYMHRGALTSLQYLANWAVGASSATVSRNLDWFAGAKAAFAPQVSGEAYQTIWTPTGPTGGRPTTAPTTRA